MSDFYFLRVPNKKYSKESLKKKRILKNKNFHYYFFNMFLLKNVQFKWLNLFVFKQNNIKWTKSNYENYSFKFFCIFLISGPFWIVGAVLKIIGTGPVSRSWKRRRKSLVLKITQILSKEDKKEDRGTHNEGEPMEGKLRARSRNPRWRKWWHWKELPIENILTLKSVEICEMEV
jgi:hypothetical protein